MNQSLSFVPSSAVGAFLCLVISACSAGAVGGEPTQSQSGQSSTTEAVVGSSCKVASDCSGALPEICEKCSDGTTSCDHFICASGKCATQICPPAPPACTKASDCTGPLPELCEKCSDGKSECAHHECDAGVCTIAYCPVAPQCKTASDCTGPLPEICEKCSNGTNECAHHACVAGVCETQICPSH